jgi:hypothetical protein
LDFVVGDGARHQPVSMRTAASPISTSLMCGLAPRAWASVDEEPLERTRVPGFENVWTA